MDSEKSRENRVRKQLENEGYQLHKSRVKKTNLDDHGGYMITDLSTNGVVRGGKHELSLDDVENFLQS